MARILVLYDSVYGHTQKIAKYIGSTLEKQNHFVDVFHVTEYPGEVSPDIYDGVIIGGPVHTGKISSLLKKWIRRWVGPLNMMPTAFFSVCLGILQEDQKVQDEEEKIVHDFFKSVGWKPDTWDIFAGELAYSKYSSVVRWLMKRIAKQAGGDTDTNSDYVYTDWDQVTRFTNEFCQDVTDHKTEMPNWHI